MLARVPTMILFGAWSALGATAWAQTPQPAEEPASRGLQGPPSSVEGEPCAPEVELADNIPPRLAQRLRHVVALVARSIPSVGPCQRARVRLVWSARELNVRVALEDGRIAVRTLESLEDVLPTLLAVLAVPVSEAVEPAEGPDAPPAPALAVERRPEALPTPSLAVERTAPAPSPAPARPPEGAWGLLVSASGGAALTGGGTPAWMVRAEGGLVWRRLVLAVRGTLRSGGEAPHPRDNRERRREEEELSPSLALSARWRLGAGRPLRAELGASAGVALDRAAEGTDPDALRWRPALGAEAALGWSFSRTMEAFVRAEGTLSLGGAPTPGAALTLGLAWEPWR